MSKDAALKLALEALETAWYHVGTFCPTDEAIELYDDARAAIKEALAQEQEHFALKHRIAELEGAVIGLQAQLAQTQEQEPVAWVWVNKKGWLTYSELPHDMWKSSPLYAHPPQRTWVGLTDEEKSELWVISRAALPRYATYASLVEAKLKEKNT